MRRLEPNVSLEELELQVADAPEDRDVLLELLVRLDMAGDNDRARELLEKAILQWPTDAGLLQRFSDAYFEKYAVRLEPGPGFGIYRLRPRRAFTWLERDFPQSATRWRWS